MAFQKHLRSVSRAASQRLGIFRKSWWVLHDRSLLGSCFQGFVLPVLECCFVVWCSAADTHLKLLHRVVSDASYILGACLSVTLLIVDMWQYFVLYIISDVTLCILFMVSYLHRMCQCGLHVVLWAPIGILMCVLAAEPRSTTRLLFPFLSVSMWNDFVDPVFDGMGLTGFKSKANVFFYWPKLLAPFLSSTVFHFLYFSKGWKCGARALDWYIGCKSHSPSLALPIFFNDNNKYNRSRAPSCNGKNLEQQAQRFGHRVHLAPQNLNVCVRNEPHYARNFQGSEESRRNIFHCVQYFDAWLIIVSIRWLDQDIWHLMHDS